MKIKVLFLFFLCLTFQINAQNNSINFDGVDDQILLNGSSSLNSFNAVTLEAWINADVWKNNLWEGTIFGRDDVATAGYVLRSGANGTLDFTVGTPGGWISATSSPIMVQGLWNHVAAVIDGNQLRIYINGMLEGSQTLSTAITPTLNNIILGESAGFAGRAFDGNIDEVRVWDVALTQAEIAANMTTDYTSATPNLVAYYKMDVINNGNSTPNVITPSNDGTLSNFSGSPLVSGYVVTTEDIAIETVDAPDLLTIFNNDAKVKVTVVNAGMDPISGFDVGYSIDGGSTFVTETLTQTLNAGETYTHIFAQNLTKAEGNFELLLNVSSSNDQNLTNNSRNVMYTMPTGNQLEIPIFVQEQHNFAGAGQTNFADVILPDSNTNYSSITMEISVNCPSTGCDPWDQPANISIIKDGQSYEIVRYIVPFGIACGGWTVDVTDFKSILTGDTNFRSFIQVWGASGWLLDAKLIYELGDVEEPYQKFTPLWNTDYQVYGEPTVSYDLPVQTVTTHPATQNVSMRMTITGHGQGNTNNAAEFSQFTHQVAANGTVVEDHVLWNTECSINPCSPQNGTWTFSRAGWCPGAAVTPYWVDLSDQVTNNSISVDYILDDYTNLLNTGYNGGSHTEPHYRIHAYLVEKSNQYIADDPLTDLAALDITSPTNETINGLIPISVLFENQGSTSITDPVLILSINGVEVATENVSAIINPGENLEYTFSYTEDFDSSLPYDIQVQINTDNDQTVSNDIVSRLVDASLGINTTEFENITIFPNPTTGVFDIFGIELNEEVNVKIYSITGAEVYNKVLTESTEINLGASIVAGIYFVELQKNASTTVRKLIVK